MHALAFPFFSLAIYVTAAAAVCCAVAILAGTVRVGTKVYAACWRREQLALAQDPALLVSQRDTLDDPADLFVGDAFASDQLVGVVNR